MLRKTPMKRGTSQLKKGTGLKKTGKLKSKPKTHQQLDEEQEQRDKDWVFYTRIWEKRNHQCIGCDVMIYGELKTIYMDHLVEKSSYPELRYEEDNIGIVCWECHSNKGNGGPISEDYKQLIEQAKIKFGVE